MPNTTVNHKVELPRAAGNGFLKEDCFNCRDDCLLFARKKARQPGEVIRLIKTRLNDLSGRRRVDAIHLERAVDDCVNAHRECAHWCQ